MEFCTRNPDPSEGSEKTIISVLRAYGNAIERFVWRCLTRFVTSLQKLKKCCGERSHFIFLLTFSQNDCQSTLQMARKTRAESKRP